MTLRSTVPGSYWRVAAAGTHAYASGFNTMVFDLSDPGAPVALGNLDHGSVPQSLTIGNGLLWSAEFSDGVTALPLQCVPTSLVSAASPASFALMPPQPNPFRDEATVAFSLLRASVVTISIHDVAGRLVRDWPTAHREAGAHQLRWDGRDAGGRPSGSGVYFVRLSSSDGTRTAKVTLLQ
ncbi:MAG: hypothetical protein DHS20C21_20920 [Gemmatimonadota bacterium]|nr:MAG: hypothetical protein DHS20C21_20920 [Gemmatimonadota bacterium]